MHISAAREALDRIAAHASAGTSLRTDFFAAEAERVHACALLLAVAFARGNKVLLCGNGGSAADCQHLAAEFVNRFVINRPPLPAIALTTDTSALTAIGNDFDFDQIFAKQVQALGQKGDILLGISTSGTSPNVVQALKVARANGLVTIGLAGRDGGVMPTLCDGCFVVRSPITALVQEVHITLGHLLCGLVDYYLIENTVALSPYLDGEIALPPL